MGAEDDYLATRAAYGKHSERYWTVTLWVSRLLLCGAAVYAIRRAL